MMPAFEKGRTGGNKARYPALKRREFYCRKKEKRITNENVKGVSLL